MLDQPTHHAWANEAAPTKYCNTHPAPPSGRLVTACGGNLAHRAARSGGLRPSSGEVLLVAVGQFVVSSDVRTAALTATAIHSRNRQYGADFGTIASPFGDHVERDREFQHALPHRRLARVTWRERRGSDVARARMREKAYPEVEQEAVTARETVLRRMDRARLTTPSGYAPSTRTTLTSPPEAARIALTSAYSGVARNALAPSTLSNSITATR